MGCPIFCSTNIIKITRLTGLTGQNSTELSVYRIS